MNETLLTPSHMGGELPTGVIIPFAGNIELDGWSVCDGGELSRTKYKNLFNVIGTTYGEGDGSTTFNKPNFIGKTIWGDTTAGVEKQAGLPNIEGAAAADALTSGDSVRTTTFSLNNGKALFFKRATDVFNTSGYTIRDSRSTNNDYTNNAIVFDASLSNSIYGNSETVQPPAITVRMIIKL